MKRALSVGVGLVMACACQRQLPLPQADAAGGVAGGPSNVSRLASCRGPSGGAAEQLALVGRCAGFDVALASNGLALGGPIVRVADPSSQTSALAWLDVDAANASVVALTLTSPDTSVAVAVRLEQLQGQAVAVEQLRTGCDAEDQHWPRRRPVIGLGVIAPRANPDCPRLVERVWRRKGDILEMVGQYAIAGTQRLSPDLRREYSSRVSFGAEGVLVTDRAEWLWLGGERRDQLWEDSYRPVVAHATTSFLRRYQLEGEVLADRSELEPWPRPEPSRGARVQVGPEMAVPCAPP